MEDSHKNKIKKTSNNTPTIGTTFYGHYKVILPFSKSEYEEFIQISNTKLPITFRINRIK